MLIRNLFCRRTAINRYFCTYIPHTIDRHQGIHIDIEKYFGNEANTSTEDFNTLLKDSISKWKEDKFNSVWLKIPISKSDLIPHVASLGFTFHHAENLHSVLSLWINDKNENRIPPFASHQVGVAGCCINNNNGKVLVVKDKGRFGKFWKFPGGLSDLSEDIGDAAVREVQEETGIMSRFESIMAIRQHHNFPLAFGKSDLFVVTRLTPLSFEIKSCTIEIEECKWVNINELAICDDITPITARVSQLIIHGLRNGFDDIDFVSNKFKSVYKGQEYWLFHTSKIS